MIKKAFMAAIFVLTWGCSLVGCGGKVTDNKEISNLNSFLNDDQEYMLSLGEGISVSGNE